MPPPSVNAFMKGLIPFHGDFMPRINFQPHVMIKVSEEYQFMANEDESVVLFMPTPLILQRMDAQKA